VLTRGAELGQLGADRISTDRVSHRGQGYSVNEADKSITFRIETSTFPNFNATEQKRAFTLVGDELTYTVPAFSGGGTAVAKWKRAN
jgi:hypothetical protein